METSKTHNETEPVQAYAPYGGEIHRLIPGLKGFPKPTVDGTFRLASSP